jgi:hypothetical protein
MLTATYRNALVGRPPGEDALLPIGYTKENADTVQVARGPVWGGPARCPNLACIYVIPKKSVVSSINLILSGPVPHLLWAALVCLGIIAWENPANMARQHVDLGLGEANGMNGGGSACCQLGVSSRLRIWLFCLSTAGRVDLGAMLFLCLESPKGDCWATGSIEWTWPRAERWV